MKTIHRKHDDVHRPLPQKGGKSPSASWPCNHERVLIQDDGTCTRCGQQALGPVGVFKDSK